MSPKAEVRIKNCSIWRDFEKSWSCLCAVDLCIHFHWLNRLMQASHRKIIQSSANTCIKTKTFQNWYKAPPFKVSKLWHLTNTFTGSQSWNRQHHGQTIHPIFKIFCVMKWAWLLLTVIASTHFGTQLNIRFIPQCHFCLPEEIKSII